MLHRVICRFMRGMKERGLIGLLVYLCRQRAPVYQSVVFRKTTGERTYPDVPGLTVIRYPNRDSVDDGIVQCIRDSGRSGMIEECERLFSRGCELWLGWLGIDIAGMCWSRKGMARMDYFVPLATDDANILSCFVLPRFRGRGVYPAMLQTMVAVLMTQDHVKAVYIDCRSWNHSSVSGIVKAGFSRLGTAVRIDAIGRHWAVRNSCRDVR